MIQNFDFIDTFQEIEISNFTQILEVINSHHLDFLISFHSKTFLINFPKKTNAKKIIIRAKFASLFSLKCKCVPISSLKRLGKNLDFETQMLFHARKINPSLFDKEIKNLNFDTQIKPLKSHQDLIKNYLESIGNPAHFIVVNPFSITANYKLPMWAWFELISQIYHKYQICIIIPTYDAVHDDFLKQIKPELLDKIYIFKNNDDLLNLCELLKRSKCLISPSTGTIHLASNLKINSIGLYSNYDMKFWKTLNEDYVLLEKTTNLLNENDINHIIKQTLQKLEKYL